MLVGVLVVVRLIEASAMDHPTGRRAEQVLRALFRLAERGYPPAPELLANQFGGLQEADAVIAAWPIVMALASIHRRFLSFGAQDPASIGDVLVETGAAVLLAGMGESGARLIRLFCRGALARQARAAGVDPDDLLHEVFIALCERGFPVVSYRPTGDVDRLRCYMRRTARTRAADHTLARVSSRH